MSNFQGGGVGGVQDGLDITGAVGGGTGLRQMPRAKLGDSTFEQDLS